MTDVVKFIDQIISSVSYKEVTLGDCISSNFGGGTPSKSVKEYWDNGTIPWASVADVTREDMYVTHTEQSITESGLENSNARIVSPGMLIAVTRIVPGVLSLPTIDVAINQDLRGLIVKPDVDPKYLVYYSKMWNVVANGSIVKGITIDTLESLPVKLPELDIQHAIVEVLDYFTMYRGIMSAQLAVRNLQLKYLRDSLFGVASDNLEKTHFLSHHKSIVGELGVTYLKVSELFNLRNGYTPSKAEPSFWADGTIPWFVMDDIRQSGSILANSSQHITPAAVKGDLFKADSIILSTSATIGFHALITVPFLCNQRFTCMTVKDAYKDKVNVKYLYHYMYVIDEWCKANTFQSSFQAVDMDSFKELLIPLPSKEVQDTIADLFDSATALIDNLSNEMSARDIQYQFYRDLILSFGGAES